MTAPGFRLFVSDLSLFKRVLYLSLPLWTVEFDVYGRGRFQLKTEHRTVGRPERA